MALIDQMVRQHDDIDERLEEAQHALRSGELAKVYDLCAEVLATLDGATGELDVDRIVPCQSCGCWHALGDGCADAA